MTVDASDSTALERAWREERARLVATLARRTGDLDLAEDAVQDAFAAAVRRWPLDGVPTRPGAWLLTAAWRRVLDVRRRTRPSVGSDDALAALPARDELEALDPLSLPVPDDVLRLILTCCHPALAPDVRVALTLRHVCGLGAREIAAALLLREETLEKRLVRARAKIREARIAFSLPDAETLPERLADVHAVIYLVFTEGHLASGAGTSALRDALSDEALWLARQLVALVPTDAESLGVLALVLVHQARRGARLDADGALVPYALQDRQRWDAAAIDDARALLARAHDGHPGPYQLEAAIALLHATATTAESVPWAHILALYDLRLAIDGSPVVAINRVLALAQVAGAVAALDALTPLLHDARVARYVPLHATHAELLERTAQWDDARAAWQRAAALASNPAMKAHLNGRAAAVVSRT